jgi:hypothetical protein
VTAPRDGVFLRLCVRARARRVCVRVCMCVRVRVRVRGSRTEVADEGQAREDASDEALRGGRRGGLQPSDGRAEPALGEEIPAVGCEGGGV